MGNCICINYDDDDLHRIIQNDEQCVVNTVISLAQ